MAGFACLLPLFSLIYIGMGIMIVSGKMPSSSTAAAHGDMIGGWIFIGVGGIFFSVGVVGAILNFLAGRSLAKHERRTLCLVVAVPELHAHAARHTARRVHVHRFGARQREDPIQRSPGECVARVGRRLPAGHEPVFQSEPLKCREMCWAIQRFSIYPEKLSAQCLRGRQA